jgi:hypothetical protein
VIGWGESDVGIETGCYDAALHMAGIENYNVMLYTSVLPHDALELPHLPDIHHSSVLEGVMAVQHTDKPGTRITAGLLLAKDRALNQVLRNLAYAGHRARTIRVQREAGSVWINASLKRLASAVQLRPWPPYFQSPASVPHGHLVTRADRSIAMQMAHTCSLAEWFDRRQMNQRRLRLGRTRWQSFDIPPRADIPPRSAPPIFQ